MKSVAQKIFITLGFITLITLSVIPVFADAQTTAASVTNQLKGVSTAGLGILMAPIIGSLYIFMSVIAAVLGFSGLILDAIINLTIVDFSSNIGKIAAINSTWKVIRDLGNMSFIFILLYEGIRMVLGLGGTGVKKVISGIIMAAILVNFSLFFTKVIIDASNIVTLGFYKSIVSSGTGTSGITTGLNAGLTGAYMSALKISSLYAPGNALETIFSGLSGVFVLSANSIFLLITVFIFLAITVMFVIRYIAFILLLIMSPVYFVSMAVPGLDGLKNKFIQTLTSQALWGPVFMLLTWVTLTLAGDTNFLNLSADQTLVGALTDPGKDTISVIINYIIIVGLLIQTLILSKSVATKGGYVTSKIIDKGTAFLGGTMFGGLAAAGRNVIGSRAAAIAENKVLQERADSGDRWAQIKIGAAKYGAKSSFDVRRSAIGEAASSRLGVDLGSGTPFNSKAGSGGFAGAKAEDKKEFEGKLDEITKRYKDKNDWAKLAGVFNTKNQKEKEYIYKSLSARERIGLDDALATIAIANGVPITQHQLVIDGLKSKLTKDEKEKTEEETVRYYQKDKKWVELATYLRSKATDAEKIYLYDKLPARDRIAFDAVLADVTLTTTLRNGLSIEEQEKTTKAEREFIKAKKEQDKLDDLHKLATDPTYAPSLTPAQIDNMVKKITPAQAKRLSEESLADPLIIPRLSERHLKELEKDGLLDSAQIAIMKTHATPAQLAYMNDPVRASNWI